MNQFIFYTILLPVVCVENELLQLIRVTAYERKVRNKEDGSEDNFIPHADL